MPSRFGGKRGERWDPGEDRRSKAKRGEVGSGWTGISCSWPRKIFFMERNPLQLFHEKRRIEMILPALSPEIVIQGRYAVLPLAPGSSLFQEQHFSNSACQRATRGLVTRWVGGGRDSAFPTHSHGCCLRSALAAARMEGHSQTRETRTCEAPRAQAQTPPTRPAPPPTRIREGQRPRSCPSCPRAPAGLAARIPLLTDIKEDYTTRVF